MRRIFSGLGVSAMFGLVLMAATARSGGEKAEKITQDKLPKKVLDAVKSWFPEPEFSSITKETTDGKVVYDLEFKYKGRKYEMDIKEDGTVLEIEKEVALKDLPEAAAKALKAKHAKATIKDVMEVNLVTGKNLKLDHYEVVLEMDGKTFEVTVTPDGKEVARGPTEKKEKK